MREQQKNHIKLLFIAIISIALLWVFLLSFKEHEEENISFLDNITPVQPAEIVPAPQPPAPLAQPEQPGAPIPLLPVKPDEAAVPSN